MHSQNGWAVCDIKCVNLDTPSMLHKIRIMFLFIMTQQPKKKSKFENALWFMSY